MRYRMISRAAAPHRAQAGDAGRPLLAAHRPASDEQPAPHDPDNPYARYFTAPRRFSELCRHGRPAPRQRGSAFLHLRPACDADGGCTDKIEVVRREAKVALDFEAMQEMQEELQEKYKDAWPPVSPKSAREKLLWMMIEAGEMADVIKKDGDEQIMKDQQIRAHFIEEMCDTLMYLNDVMLCYQIEPAELEAKYIQKHEINMKRW